MDAIKVVISGFYDASQPGWVECFVEDAWGRKWQFIEKIPVLTSIPLSEDSVYPCAGAIACTIVRRWDDMEERDVLTVDTKSPWGICAIDGTTQFDVRPEQLVNL